MLIFVNVNQKLFTGEKRKLHRIAYNYYIAYKLFEVNMKKIFRTLFSIFVFLILSVTFASCNSPEKETQAKKNDLQTQKSSIDKQVLVGGWQRPDGGYILKVDEVRDDGTLAAAYYNPNPIEVGRTEWNIYNNEIKVTKTLITKKEKKQGKKILVVQNREIFYK